MHKRLTTPISFALALILTGCAAAEPNQPAPEPEPPAGYLFSYFVDNGQDGLHLHFSHDGLNWRPLNHGQSFLAPEVGSKLMRDPSIVRAPDGLFHMVWTTGWWDNGIGHASSHDLIHWSQQQFIPVMANEPNAKNSWAPELFYDDTRNEFLIFWATTIPGRFPKTEGEGDNNHRIYCTTTKDFQTFSPTRLFYDPGFNVIDSFIAKTDQGYVMFLKHEHPQQKNIRTATADDPQGPWSQASDPITGQYWAEGPAALKIENRWLVYFDKYTEHQYGAVMSEDLKNWTDISRKVHFPPSTRHGTAFPVDSDTLKRLQTP